ncbi:LacI family DNA-binding transcriptional regulator [Aureibaculum sp. A20]|uniref:LacI family DNA-binding transcriptional regulator n=1 Tax=Aureibaculum flavum TaxID=2795986 RepID=A0ABS0WX10_9FLAO|nr:LacI family DNA-binding transcriptional regulator [Aureibaculum flavum]MBJ2176514.1 LacI family DNA-binding transcriptional regulator [Aureibaculum flavum]
MKKKSNVTLKEIAKILGFSISTVSRALRDHVDISDETKAIVEQKAKELNYMPNMFAQGFRSSRMHIIGVVVPKLSHYFTSTMIEGILDYAETKGYRVIVSESKNSVEKQNQMLNTMLQFNVDGILLSLTRKTANVQDILNILDRKPLVLFDKVMSKIPCTQIIIDGKQAAYNAIEHLINIGKRRIAIFKETENSFNSEQRFEGYLKALKDYNIPIDEKLIFSTEDISLEKGEQLAQIAITLKQRPDAIFAITDSCAIGAIKILNKNNIKIPEEIAVVGFSNSAHSTIIEPNLSTINQPGHLIGKTALKYLIEEIETDNNNDFQSSKTVEIKSSLIVRDSSFIV